MGHSKNDETFPRGNVTFRYNGRKIRVKIIEYVAGWNRPGYLPDSIESYSTQEEAREATLHALAEAKEAYIDDGRMPDGYAYPDSDVATFDEARASVAKEDGEFDTGSMPDGYNYFVLEGEGFRYEG